MSSDLPSTSRSLLHLAESSATRSLQLRIAGVLPDEVLTLTNVTTDGASLIVELLDSSGSRVTAGPESSAKLKLAVLNGDFAEDTADWTEEDYNRNVAQPRKDNRPLLRGNCEISMSNGVAVFTKIQFTDTSKWTRCGKFKLGIQVVEDLPPGIVARGAVSNAFKVMDHRAESYAKHITPSLEDKVWRLRYIAKDGKICQKLAAEEIYTVQDLLQLYHTNENKLRHILQVSEKIWTAIVRNAEQCTVTSKCCYRYHNEEAGVVLLLDCVFNIMSATFKDQINQPYGILNDSQKDLVHKLRVIAFERRTELAPVYYDPINEIQVQGERALQVNDHDLAFDLTPYFNEQRQHEGGNQHATADENKRKGKEDIFKWVSRVINVLIEIWQATVTQENATGRISNPAYRILSVITSLICLLIALADIIYEVKVSKAVWQKRRYCCWLYYPGRQGRLFWKFSLYFGVFSSTVQFGINLSQLLAKRKLVNFDSLQLLLSFSYLVAAMADPGPRAKRVVHCSIHGSCVFQCPQCQQSTSA